MPFNKKQVLLGVSLAVIGLALIGCSGNDGLEARYQAEKMLFQANKAVRDAQIKPELNPPGTADSLRNKFGRAAEFCFAALDRIDAARYPTEHTELAHLAYQATSRLSQYLFAQRRFDSCQTLMTRLLSLDSLSEFERTYATINLGQVHQASGRWDSAVATYNRAVENYFPPLDPQGEIVYKLFNLPAHMFSIYTKIEDTSAAREYFLRAETYYDELVQQQDGSDLGDAARTTLASLYSFTGQPDQAIAELQQVTDTAGQTTLGAALQIAEIEAEVKGNYSSAYNQYETLRQRIEQLPPRHADREIEPYILFKQAMILIEREQYSEARDVLQTISDEHSRFYDTFPPAQLAKARSFDLEGNWDRAFTEYRFLIEHYAGTDEALSTYLYLERYFTDNGRPTEAERWYNQGLQTFSQLAAREGLPAARALTYQADMYRQREEWEQAARTLGQLFERFPESNIGRQALLTASVVNRDKLGRAAVADSLIEVYKRSLIDFAQQPQL